MKLNDVNGGGNFYYQSCDDEKMSARLLSFGFIKGVELVVVSRARQVFVVDVLGSRFAINERLAEKINLQKADSNVE